MSANAAKRGGDMPASALQSLTVNVAKISAKTRWVFVEIARADGAIGIGEATLVGSEAAVLAAVSECASQLRSFGAPDPGAFAATIVRKTLAQAAIVSAIDLALWD